MRLTIITICRNEISRIQRTLDSIQSQSCQDFEWIAVDGGSTDGTLALLEKQSPLLSRILSGPDRGIYDAMNKGILAASGDYILFINAGDWLENRNVVSNFINQAFKTDLVVGDIRVIYPDGHEQYRGSQDRPIDPALLYWRSLPHQATFIKRTLFTQFGPYDLSFTIAGDWEFFARVLITHGATRMAWPYCVSVYTNDGISAVPENRQRLHAERQRIRHRYYPAHYRWRREFNEAWGRTVHRLRTRNATPP